MLADIGVRSRSTVAEATTPSSEPLAFFLRPLRFHDNHHRRLQPHISSSSLNWVRSS